MKFNPSLLEISILVVVSVISAIVTANWRKWWRWWQEWRKTRRGPRHLHPRSPESCPRCSKSILWLPDRPRREITPWRERKSKAGRPKRIDTSGFACVNWQCEYYGNADSEVHALVSDGKRNGIQYWRCQACGERKTSRWGTPMYRVKTALWRVRQVMMAMSEGVDQSAASRIFQLDVSGIVN